MIVPGAEPEIQVHRRIGRARLKTVKDAVVVAAEPAFRDAPEVESDDVERDAESPKFLEKRHGALSNRGVLLHQHREPHRSARRIFELAVPIAVGEARGCQEPARLRGIVGVARDVGRAPRAVPRRDRAKTGTAAPRYTVFAIA